MVVAPSPRDKLGDQLIAALQDAGRIDASGLKRLREAAKKTGKRPDRLIVELGLVDENAILATLQQALCLPTYSGETLSEIAVSRDYLRAKMVVPLIDAWGVTGLGMVDVLDDLVHTAICIRTGSDWPRIVLERSQFERLLPEADHAPSTKDEGADTLSDAELAFLREAGSSVPVIQYLQELLQRAVQMRASDIHLRSGPRRAKVHLRIDGDLCEVAAPTLEQLPEVVSRLKLLAHLDIAERRLPQDGRLRVTVAGKATDFRLSTMPQLNGEGAVLRILNKDASTLDVTALGFEAGVVEKLNTVSGLTGGLVLVVGPTGSGKTTTLYALLNSIVRPNINVVTIEDPIEYRLEGAAQIQVDERTGLTFPRALRSVLRQDPDVILVGEIRDSETAQIAIQAALTGHLVLASLHAETARKSVPRLLDMGVEPYMLQAVLRGALGQRLIRSRCACSTPQETVGCENCAWSGYSGRHAVGEFVEFADSKPEEFAALTLRTSLAPIQAS